LDDHENNELHGPFNTTLKFDFSAWNNYVPSDGMSEIFHPCISI